MIIIYQYQVKILATLFFIIMVLLFIVMNHNNISCVYKIQNLNHHLHSYTVDESSNYAKKLVLEHFMKTTPERRKLIEAIVPNPPFKEFNYVQLHHALQVPEVRCVDLSRLGTVRDGGKLVCNPARAKDVKNCVVYSFGIHVDISFEQDFHEISGRNCKIRAIDELPLEALITKGLQDLGADILKTTVDTNTTVKTTSFTDIVNKYGDKAIEILKMDIEGTEEKIIDQIFHIPICQILIEIHGAYFNKKIEDVYKTVQLLKKFSAHGFWLYSNELHPTVWNVREYSWIHQNCMERYGVNTILGKYIV